MLTANVATTKNELSRLLRCVKRGETVVITERKHPIARLQPYHPSPNDSPSGDSSPATLLAPLIESGVLTPPRLATWDVQTFLSALTPVQPLPADRNLVAAVVAERAESP